eukprot:scaffold234578_cov15-Tisochrysis_lutea.AAC.1
MPQVLAGVAGEMSLRDWCWAPPLPRSCHPRSPPARQRHSWNPPEPSECSAAAGKAVFLIQSREERCIQQ